MRNWFALGLVVFIGGLTLWANAPVYTGGHRDASVMDVKSALKNLASQQEIYFSDHETFTADWGALQFSSRPDVTVTIFAVSDSGWAARGASFAFERDAGVFTGADCVTVYGKVPELPRTSIKRRTPDEDRPIVCDMEGWDDARSRLNRWLWLQKWRRSN
jgi:Tfp pilus assembly protein PilE